MEFLTTLIFIVVVIASLAQKFQETRKANDARRLTQDKSKPGEVSPAARRRMMEGSASASANKARQTIERVSKAGGGAAEATGRELIGALFGEGSADSDDGWEEVHPEHRPVPKREIQAVPQQARPEHARDAALQQREKMEHDRTPAHSLHGAHPGREPSQEPLSRAKANRAKASEEKRRQQVSAERQGRKQQAEQQRRQASQGRRSQQARPRGIIAPVARGGLIPRNLVEVRRAIVMAEILGRPKAFE